MVINYGTKHDVALKKTSSIMNEHFLQVHNDVKLYKNELLQNINNRN